MNKLSIIGTAAAYLNYKNAKAEYEALKEKADAILAAVQTYTNLKQWVLNYNEHKNETYLPHNDIDPDAWMDKEAKINDIPENITMSSILRLSYMVGKWCNGKVSVVMTNLSDTKSYYIDYIKAVCFIDGLPINLFYNVALTNKKASEINPDAREQYPGYVLKPNETKEFEFAIGKTQILGIDEETGETVSKVGYVRDIICEAAGKKLITSCPKINIEDVETAAVIVKWCEGDSFVESDLKECWFYELPGILRYCMELPL